MALFPRSSCRGWLLAAETISAGQTTRPPEIIIDITSDEIRPYLPKHSPRHDYGRYKSISVNFAYNVSNK